MYSEEKCNIRNLLAVMQYRRSADGQHFCNTLHNLAYMHMCCCNKPINRMQ